MIAWIFALELGLLSGGMMVEDTAYFWPEKSTYVLMEVEAQYYGLFMGGEIENIQYPIHSASYSPVHIDYRFNTGFRWQEFEIGWRHECRHPVIGRSGGSPLRGSHDKFYVRAEIKR